jgi:HAD superfamily hydrolase (TIGR01509 family)
MKALIFDMDGLMIDTERLYFETEREMARSFGKEVKDETLWKMMGRSPTESLRVFAEDLMIAVPAGELARIREERMAEKMKADIAPMKGLYEIIHTFSGRLKLAIATGSPQRLMDIAIDRLGIRKKFDILQASEEIPRGKPHPDIYLRTAQRLGSAPEECVVLEDSENGAKAGLRAGCYTIAIPSEYTNKQDFSGVDFLARDLLEARKHIEGLLADG